MSHRKVFRKPDAQKFQQHLFLPYILKAYSTLTFLGAPSLNTDIMSRKSSNVMFPSSVEENTSQIRSLNGFTWKLHQHIMKFNVCYLLEHRDGAAIQCMKPLFVNGGGHQVWLGYVSVCQACQNNLIWGASDKFLIFCCSEKKLMLVFQPSFWWYEIKNT